MKQVVKRLVFISQKLLEIFFKNLNDRPGDLEQLEKMERSLLSYKDQRGLTPLHKVRGSNYTCSATRTSGVSPATQGERV